jgi:hypothetical protein
VSELRSWLAALDNAPGSASEGSVLEERSNGSLRAVEGGRSYAEVLHLPPYETVVSVGHKCILS